uniref:SLAIN motif family, member 1a n=1 Tax=Mastacembelus armatus TaxID=205130 RepID=A0A3Q3SK63_9TELE
KEKAKSIFCFQNIAGAHSISPQSSLDSDVGVSELEDDSISMSYKLQDMTDVEVMARLQEESLRQDYASTSATASRRSSSFSLQSLRRSELDLEEEDEDDEGYDQLPPPQPRLFRTGSMQRGSLPHSHTFSSIRDCRRSSVSPQFSLSGLSQYSGPSSLTTETHTAYRNTTGGCLINSLFTSISSLRSSQSFDSSSGLIRLQSSIPSPGQLSQRVQSVGNFPTTARHPTKATAYVSPTVQQGPTSISLSTSTSLHSIPTSTNQPAVPRSSLPRPASFVGTSGVPRASKITQATRSLLTPPRSLAALTTLRDGSWKDGCY